MFESRCSTSHGLLWIVSLVSLSLPAQVQAADTDQAAFKGKWKTVEAYWGSKAESAEDIKNLVWVIDDYLTPYKGNEAAGTGSLFNVDTSKSPFWLDTGSQLGLCKLQGDTLEICLGRYQAPRPTTLAPGKGTFRYLKLTRIAGVAGGGAGAKQPATRPQADPPEGAVKAWYEAIVAGNYKLARSHVADIPGFPEEAVARDMQSVAKNVAAGQRLLILAGRGCHGCGVVLVRTMNGRPMEYYLIQQSGKWKLLPAYNEVRNELNKLSPEQLEDCELLSYWAEVWAAKYR